jgi:outer membrane protein assembly factor BamE (lipoprotein component of BamABCDE complex)
MVAVVVVALACAGAGKRFDTTHVPDIRKGQQDRDQIRGWFGDPYQKTPLQGHPAGCVERWTYTHAFSKAGISTTSETLIVDFDAAGKVCDHAYAEQG